MSDQTPPLPPVSPQALFCSANLFEQAAAVVLLEFQRRVQVPDLSRYDGRVTLLIFEPAFAMFAFASELYLKCLILIDTGRVVRGHDLRRLFDRLPPGRQQDIRARFAARAGAHGAARPVQPEDEFDPMLDRMKDFFEVYRYAHELRAPGGTFRIPVLCDLLRPLLLEINPAWAALIGETQPTSPPP